MIKSVLVLLLLPLLQHVLVAQLQYLPAEPPARPNTVVAGMIKVRLTREAAAHAEFVLQSLGLTVERKILPTLPRTDVQLLNMNAAEERLQRSYVVRYENIGIPPEKVVAQLLAGCGPIECAAPWCVAELTGEPNDPMLNQQQMLRTIKAFDAWDVEPGSDTVVIGISDSGTMFDHEDLRNTFFARKGEVPDNGIDDDGNGYEDDYQGYNFTATKDSGSYGNPSNPKNSHGTGVAGICAASVNNGVGIAGVTKNCKLFPLRTMPDNSTGIVYGYESIMYCALNNIPVVNCSWGSRTPSCIDQDVIEFAISRGTAVVAAAGNHNSASPFYPASYRGVLSVGVVNPSDAVIEMTGRGPTVDVMAPGHDSWTTDNNGAYFGFCCTSGSAPIASAIVAMVRSKHPQLTALEACAVVRDAVDEQPWTQIPDRISPLLLPRGRVNALLAVTADPDTLVSLSYDTVYARAASGAERWTVGDTVIIVASVRNELASWTLQKIDTLRLVSVGEPALSPLTTVGGAILLERGATVELPPMRFVVERETDTTVYAVADLVGTDGNERVIRRRISVPITPAPAFTNIRNTRLVTSIGDRGRIGNTDIERGQGLGFSLDRWCGQLYEGGLMVYANGSVVDAVRAIRGTNEHFRPTKRFVSPNAERGIVTDADAPDSLRIGVSVELSVAVDTESPMIVIDAAVTNESEETLHNLSVAWFYDWDLGSQPAANHTYQSTSYSQVTESTSNGSPIVRMYVSSGYYDARPILCGLDNTTTYAGFSTQRKINIFESSESIQFDGTTDVANIVGMRFEMPVPPGHRRTFRHAIVLDTNMTAVDGSNPNKFPNPADSLYAPYPGRVFPVPASSVVYVSSPFVTFSPATFAVYDALGRVVKTVHLESVLGGEVVLPINVEDLPIGSYIIRNVNIIDERVWPVVISR